MKKNGFTLLETLIAMMILSSALIVLSSSWSGSYARVQKTKIKSEVIALLQRKMVEIDAEYRGKPLDSIDEEKEDNFGDDYPQYRWKMTSKEFSFPDLGPMLTSKEDGANEMLLMVMKQLSEHLGKTVKEVKVSVFYKPPKGDEVEYSVSTYFVDYDKELPLPAIPGGG